ncbi:hypothetical protein HanPI659440_Chr05g0184001 [Helianthus annuus]|nr:hypothetical protein HanPI659440_Chr05g0184001 [Helianthus annuus]
MNNVVVHCAMKEVLTWISSGDNGHTFEITRPSSSSLFLIVTIKCIRSMILYIIRRITAFPRLNLRTICSSRPTSPIQSCLQCFTINTIHCNTKCLICSIICQKFTAPGYMKQVNRS